MDIPETDANLRETDVIGQVKDLSSQVIYLNKTVFSDQIITLDRFLPSLSPAEYKRS